MRAANEVNELGSAVQQAEDMVDTNVFVQELLNQSDPKAHFEKLLTEMGAPVLEEALQKVGKSVGEILKKLTEPTASPSSSPEAETSRSWTVNFRN